MPRNRTVAIAASIIAAFAVPTAFGSSIDINGGASWGGWEFRGQSTDEGIWVAGNTTGVYEIYTTSFQYDGQQVTGSPMSGMDLSGFQAGDRIFGVGIRAISGLSQWNGSGNWRMVPTVFFDLGGDSLQAASTVGGSDGQSIMAEVGHAGDFAVDFNNWSVVNLPDGQYRPTNLLVQETDGTNWGGTPEFNLYGGPNGDVANDVWPHVRSFFDPSGGTWQALFNLDSLQTVAGIGEIGDEFSIATSVWNGETTTTSDPPWQDVFTVGMLNIQTIPLPPAAVTGLVGILGVCIGSRRLRKASQAS